MERLSAAYRLIDVRLACAGEAEGNGTRIGTVDTDLIFAQIQRVSIFPPVATPIYGVVTPEMLKNPSKMVGHQKLLLT